MDGDGITLRIAIGLAHAIPTSRIELTLCDGSVAAATHGDPTPGSLTVCGLRAMAIMDPVNRWSRTVATVRSVTVGGANVNDLGGGLYACRNDRATDRCFATVLAPSTVERLLESCPIQCSQTISATLRADGDLGVTVVFLSIESYEHEALLEETARWAASACCVEELVHTVQATG
jgi:hypothetical protein